MNTWARRTVIYTVVLVTVMLAYALVYDFGMGAFEGEPVTFLHALQVIVETFTTTGFGSDSPWTSSQMNILVIVMDLTGVALIFLALPVLVFPLLQEALSTSVPTSVEGYEDHVVVCGFSARTDTLINELESWSVKYVIVEPSRNAASGLYDDGYTVINAEPDATEGLEAACTAKARALVADVSDEVDTSIILTAKEMDESTRVVSVVEEPDRAKYHELAGADEVLSPRTLLGESLARKVTTAVSTELGDAIELGEDFDVVELPVRRGSDLVGTTLAESGLRERVGVNVIGAWFEGEFQTPPDPNTVIGGGTVLLVTGRQSQLERLKELTIADVRRFGTGQTVVVGYGQVGQKVTAALEEAGLPNTVVDRREITGVDVIGDATDPDVLREAEVQNAYSVVLALPNDTTAEFATLVVRDLAPHVELIARIEETETLKKIYRAGADYVLSLGSITGRMAASAVLDDEDVISLDRQVDVVRTKAPGITGMTLREADVRARTGCTVVAVERDGEVITDVGPEFRAEPDDGVIIAGTDDGVNQFIELLG